MKTRNNNETTYLLSYLKNVLMPASYEFSQLLEKNQVRLYHAFSFNSIVTHAIDYMVFIAKMMGTASRAQFICEFDGKYYVQGSQHINNKFRLLDAINNSFKHVELDSTRYPDLIYTYGELSIHSLKESDGKVFFVMPNYRFDYCRVVLKPVAATFDCGLETPEDILKFVNGDICGCAPNGNFCYEYESHDSIDRMIDYCNPACLDCGEGKENCDCQTFFYAGKRGEFAPDQDPNFDFENVMSNISGSKF